MRPLVAQTNGRPIRLILPISAGSGVDTITRAAGPALTRALGNTVVIENMPGAGGIIGTSAIVREPPDGHTLGMVSNNHVIFPSVFKSVPFDALADITPISVIGATPFVLVAHPSLPANNATELVKLLQANPEAYNYASSGNGTTLHLAVEMFLQKAGVKARHIPYRGSGPMTADIMGNQVQFGVLSLPAVAPHIQSGALKALGLCGRARSPLMPELATLAEQGIPDYEMEGWFALIGPKGMDPAQAQRLYEATRKAFEDPETQRAMAAQGNRIAPRDPAASRAYFESEFRKYADVVKAARIEAQ
ncbi:tripartite tricarboxylate transporter substrate binding protein [Achromobacter sp. GG226]|nr:tripartite tricarboxylate transporter substrate binding protein [Verticiella sp. GG226]